MLKEYIEREAALKAFEPQCGDWSECWSAEEIKPKLESIPAADVVEVKLLEDGTLVVTTDKYPNVTRVFVEDGKTSGSLFYADEV